VSPLLAHGGSHLVVPAVSAAVVLAAMWIQNVIRKRRAGPHLLEAEFVAADHGPFDPRIIVSVPFTVE
jgi:hypothetical protein